MPNDITTIVPPALRDLADQVLALEATTDADLAQAGRLLVAATEGRSVAKISVSLSQPVFDSLARLVTLKVEGRKELCAAHGTLRKLGKMAMPELPWGPVQPCPAATKSEEVAPVTPLRIAG